MSTLTALLHRGVRVARWLVPGTLLALMPKCPACFAAYVAAGTGFGLSLPAAAQLRGALIAACLGSLVFLVVRTLVRRRRRCGSAE